MADKKQTQSCLSPIVGRKLRKIGERHGEFMDEKYAPVPEKKEIHKLPIKQKLKILTEFKEELKKKATKSELYFRGKLKEYGISHTFQRGIVDHEQFIIADFCIDRLNLIVEIDGGYHETEKQQARDYYKDKHYRRRNFNVLRIKNEDVEKIDYVELAKSYYTKKLSDNIKNMLCVSEREVKILPAEKETIGVKKKKNGKLIKVNNKKVKKEGDSCRHCNTPVIKRASSGNNRRKGQRFYYPYHYYCPNCKSIYLDNNCKTYFNKKVF